MFLTHARELKKALEQTFFLYIALYTEPPLLILEFVPYGDLLGYLKKSRGETDNYYNLKSAENPRKIPAQQLYRFASDIARGMEFISANQVSWLNNFSPVACEQAPRLGKTKRNWSRREGKTVHDSDVFISRTQACLLFSRVGYASIWFSSTSS